MIKELLSNNSTLSSMRFALISVIAMCTFITLCIGVYIIILAAKDSTVDWVGLAVIIAAMSTFIGAAVAGKVQQKKQEIQHETK